MKKLRHWGINEVTSKSKRCFVVNVFYLYLLNFVGNGIVYLDFWEKLLNFNSILKIIKLSMPFRSTKQCPVCFTCSVQSIK